MKPPIKVHRQHSHRNRRTSPYPNEMRVYDSRGDYFAKGRRQGVREEEESHDECFHVLWGTGICQLVGGDIAEAFGDSPKSDVGYLEPNIEWGDDAVVAAGGSVIAAGRGLVNVVLENGAIDSGDPSKREPEGDA